MKTLQKNRLTVMISMFAYLTLNAWFFAVVIVAPRNRALLLSACATGMISQGIVIYTLKLVKENQ